MEQQYKSWVIEELENWAETFNNNFPNHLEETIEEDNKAYSSIYSLVEKLTKDECSKKDYENILFHLWQIKYDS
jgi:hypothetical protein